MGSLVPLFIRTLFNVRIDPELHKKIYQEALKAGVSLNAFIQQVLKKEVLQQKIF